MTMRLIRFVKLPCKTVPKYDMVSLISLFSSRCSFENKNETAVLLASWACEEHEDVEPVTCVIVDDKTAAKIAWSSKYCLDKWNENAGWAVACCRPASHHTAQLLIRKQRPSRKRKEIPTPRKDSTWLGFDSPPIFHWTQPASFFAVESILQAATPVHI